MEMKKYKLNDVCLKITDGSHFSPKAVDFGYPMYSVKDMNEFGFNDSDYKMISEDDFKSLVAAGCRPQKDDVLIAKDGSYLKYAFVCKEEKDEVILSSIAILRPNKDIIDPTFFSFLLRNPSVKKSMKYYVSGTALPRIVLDNFKKMEINIPGLSEQKKIGDMLSTLDKRIENLRAQNRVLEQTAKTIYDYTFLQCAGHQTTYNKTLNRNIPTNWEVSTIGCYIKESKGGDWGKENPEKNYNLQVSCIRGADIEKMTDLPIRYILAKNSSKLLQEFDLVVEISGGSPTQSTGRSRLMTKELLEMFDNKLICSNFCQAVTMKNPQYAYYISFMWKMFYDNGIFFNFEGKTSGIKNFQLDQFVDTMWFFPDLKTVEKFNAQVAPLIKKQLFNAKQIEALTTQRNTLLPLLMIGQVEVM